MDEKKPKPAASTSYDLGSFEVLACALIGNLQSMPTCSTAWKYQLGLYLTQIKNNAAAIAATLAPGVAPNVVIDAIFTFLQGGGAPNQVNQLGALRLAADGLMVHGTPLMYASLGIVPTDPLWNPIGGSGDNTSGNGYFYPPGPPNPPLPGPLKP